MQAWMRNNLATQGYCLSDDDARDLRIGLRFSTGLCLALVVTGLALESPALILALVPIGAVAGFTARHPFDHLWNAVARTKLPPNPPRRRHAFKLATFWVAAVGVLFATGATTAALVLGGLLVAACATVTATNLCIPSEALGWLERRRRPAEAVTT